MKYGIFIILVVVIAIVLLLFTIGPNLNQYDYLKNPVINQKINQKVVVVEMKGDPNTVGSDVYKLLFKTYFKTPGVTKGPKQPAPRARWPLAWDTPKEQWMGLYALPVPDSTTILPVVKNPKNLKISLDTWQYGEVAEVLHTGPYTEEKPTIDKLYAFIQQQGYKISGIHEEEYIKGPGMFFKGDPKKYKTIIRYTVVKADSLKTDSTKPTPAKNK